MVDSKAVIFDLDGVIIYSESLAHKAWNAFLRTCGAQMTAEEYRQLIGMDSRFSVDHVRKQKNIDLPQDDILQEVWEHKLSIIREEAEPAPGAASLLDALRARGLAIGLASNSKGEYVNLTLETMQFRPYFQVVVTADDVSFGKPAPDLYLHAAAALGQPPERCLAIEDSPAGVRAAQAAGMRCVVIPNPELRAQEFPPSYASYPDLIALQEALDGLLDGG